MQISSKFDHTKIEKKWYSFWNKNNFFNSEPDDREPFTIVIPPPNVTGLLHMGHMLNNTIQDILIRKARMMGKNACTPYFCSFCFTVCNSDFALILL